MEKWSTVEKLRDDVNAVLEAARAEKKIGKALEARVTLTVPAEDAFLAEMDADQLADLLIVSQATASVGTELSVSVEEAEGAKCERCWKQSPAVGSDAAHPTLCPRCAAVVAKLPQF